MPNAYKRPTYQRCRLLDVGADLLVNVARHCSVPTLCALAACCRELASASEAASAERFGFTRLRGASGANTLTHAFMSPVALTKEPLFVCNYMLFDEAAKEAVEHVLKVGREKHAKFDSASSERLKGACSFVEQSSAALARAFPGVLYKCVAPADAAVTYEPFAVEQLHVNGIEVG